LACFPRLLSRRRFLEPTSPPSPPTVSTFFRVPPSRFFLFYPPPLFFCFEFPSFIGTANLVYSFPGGRFVCKSYENPLLSFPVSLRSTDPPPFQFLGASPQTLTMHVFPTRFFSLGRKRSFGVALCGHSWPTAPSLALSLDCFFP